MAYKDPRRGVRATGNACGSAPPSAAPRACARDAAKRRPYPIAACASPAARSVARPSAPATRSARPPARRDTRTLRKRKRACAGATGSAPPRASPEACVRSAGKAPLVPDRSLCGPCGEKRRQAERARYAKGQAAGKLYGGRDPKDCRRIARKRSRQILRARRGAGLCTRCGHRPPVEGGTTCEPCRNVRRAAEREQYAVRRAAGLCGRCGGPAFDGAPRCGPCAAIEAGRQPRKNAASRKRYARRRARWLCTDCGHPSQGAARCVPCARRSYVRSGQHRGLPIWPPSYTVIEIATARTTGPGTARPRWPCAWPSRGCRTQRWKS